MKIAVVAASPIALILLIILQPLQFISAPEIQPWVISKQVIHSNNMAALAGIVAVMPLVCLFCLMNHLCWDPTMYPCDLDICTCHISMSSGWDPPYGSSPPPLMFYSVHVFTPRYTDCTNVHHLSFCYLTKTIDFIVTSIQFILNSCVDNAWQEVWLHLAFWWLHMFSKLVRFI